MKKFSALLAAAALSSLISSCELINPEEDAPCYVQIDSFSLTTNYSTQGTASHKLKDAWVYIDNELIGVFELPARFPVLKAGTKKMLVGSGILNNGIASTRVVYPFIKYYESDITLAPEQTIQLGKLPVTYFPGKNYTWFEDFEGSGYSLDTLSNSQAPLIIDTQNPFEGNKCLQMQVTSAKGILECASINSYPIAAGADAYLELNYRCDQAFTLGIVANYSGGNTVTAAIITFNPSADWNKTYVELRKVIGNNFPTASSFNIWFRMDLADGKAEGNAWVDNLKLMNN